MRALIALTSVQMKYVGRLKANGKVFDASKGAPFAFRLGIGEVIKARARALYRCSVASTDH